MKLTRAKSSKNLKSAVKPGFTMVEFSLSMAFIAALLISIAIIISNIVTIYQKGLTLKAVNSVGRGLIDEFTESINAAPSVDTVSLCNSHIREAGAQEECKQKRAFNFIFQHRYGESPLAISDDPTKPHSNVQFAGVFCTGNYSYIWNTYYGQEANRTVSLRYNDTAGNEQFLNDFRLARFEDKTYRACSASTNSYNYAAELENSANANYEIDIRTLANGAKNYTPTPTQGFLNSFDLDLMLYEFTIFPISQDEVTLRTFMSGTFILATERGRVNIVRSGDYCDVNGENTDDTTSMLNDLGSEFNYCSINKFNFAARTAGV